MKQICKSIRILSFLFLLSTSSLLDGESWEQLRVFVGTCLGPVHLFAPAQNGGRIVRTFHGNNVSKCERLKRVTNSLFRECHLPSVLTRIGWSLWAMIDHCVCGS